jgi:hypothetical protein
MSEHMNQPNCVYESWEGLEYINDGLGWAGVMSKRVVPGKPFRNFVQENADECKRLSDEVAQYDVYLTRIAGITTEKEYTEKQKVFADLRVRYSNELDKLRRADPTVFATTLEYLKRQAAARAEQKDANDSQLAEQRKGYTKMNTFTDIVHVLSARLSELEDHVCIKVNGV